MGASAGFGYGPRTGPVRHAGRQKLSVAFSPMMLFRLTMRLTVPLLLALMLTSSSWAQTGAEGLILLLKNGSIVEGEITPTDKGFRVKTAAGSQYLLETRLVRGAFRNLREIFEQKKADALSISNPAQALHELFHWSLSTKRLEFASEVLELLETVVKDPQTLRRYQRQLESAVARSRPSYPAETSPAAAGSDGELEGDSGAATSLTWNSTTANATTPETDSASAEPTAIVADRYQQYRNDPWSLNREINGLPAGAYHAFRKMQPDLLAGCQAANCHSQTTEEFFLLPPPFGNEYSKHITSVNLAEVLRQVDANLPDSSPLLRHLTEAHGGQSEPAFSADSETVYQLRYWTFYVVGLEHLWYQEKFDLHQEQLQQAAAAAAANRGQTLPQDGAPLSDEDDLQQALNGQLAGLSNSAMPGSKNSSVDPEQLHLPTPRDLLPQPARTSLDPFDPAEFNRQAAARNSAVPNQRREPQPSSSTERRK